MGVAGDFLPAQVFVGVIFSLQASLKKIEDQLQAACGAFLCVSPDFPFEHTTYYEAEMGHQLRRRFYCFRTPIPVERLSAIKHLSNQWEQEFAIDGKRIVNLDPGYLTPYQVVLLTTKNYAHRIALARGIYAELTYTYRQGAFYVLPWTYPDFCFDETKVFFKSVRDLFFALS